MRTFALLIGIWLSCSVHADESVWLGPDRKNWSNTEFRKIENDFAGVLLVTPDVDWRQKWNTPPDTIPRFREAKTARIGQELVILTFFANPKVDAKNTVNVTCRIKVTRPNNTISVNQRNIPCMKGQIVGNPEYVQLSPAVIHFVGEKTDPVGKWMVDAEIEDLNRNTTLHLRTQFTLIGSDG